MMGATPQLIAISLPPEQLELLEFVAKGLKENSGRKNAEVWLTIDEVAERFKVKSGTIRKWMADYQFPHSKLSEVLRFSPVQVDAWFMKFNSEDFSQGMKILSSGRAKTA
ncbi:helix-turn-helix domain-containing protein [Emticicia fontis]